MRIESAVYGNRWRKASAAAKAVFAVAGLSAALAAPHAGAALACGLLMAVVTLCGARIAPGVYLRVLLPASSFLLLGSLPLAFAVGFDDSGNIGLRWVPEALPQIAHLLARAFGAFTALLFLSLSTPLPDLIALARRLRVPAALIDLMVLGYRTLFMLLRALHDMYTAQDARLGYSSARKTLRSGGLLTANLIVDLLQRARALQLAAQARNQDGPLRFLPAAAAAHPLRDAALAMLGAVLLFALAFLLPAPGAAS